MKYKILRNETRPDLEQEIAKYLAEGWEFQGGVSVSHPPWESSVSIIYAQAMILPGQSSPTKRTQIAQGILEEILENGLDAVQRRYSEPKS